MARTLFTSRLGGDLKIISHRNILRQTLALERLHFMRQSHSDLVMVVDEEGGDFTCDALVTRSLNVGLAALSADCMPVTFRAEGVIGVAHVGRVGLVSGLAPKVVNVMRSEGAQEITAMIGPSICSLCYEVSAEMYSEITSLLPATSTSLQRRALNLRAGLTSQLSDCGVMVRDSDICTLENLRYFSFRGGDLQARQAGIISL